MISLISSLSIKLYLKSLSQKIFFPEKREMVNEDDGREDLFCTAGNISAFATAYSHGRYRLLNLKKNKTKQNKNEKRKLEFPHSFKKLIYVIKAK